MPCRMHMPHAGVPQACSMQTFGIHAYGIQVYGMQAKACHGRMSTRLRVCPCARPRKCWSRCAACRSDARQHVMQRTRCVCAACCETSAGETVLGIRIYSAVTCGVPVSIARESEHPVPIKSMPSNPVSASDILIFGGKAILFLSNIKCRKCPSNVTRIFGMECCAATTIWLRRTACKFASAQ
eukprot:6180039-Pleurochrysis_carterae.AAC.2